MNRWMVVAAGAGLFLFGGAQVLEAAAAPAVTAATVARDTTANRTILTLVGQSLTKFTGFTLTDSQAQPVPGTVETLVRGKTLLVLGLPTGLAGGEYDLTPATKAGPGQVFHLRVEDGTFFATGVTTTASGYASTAAGSGTIASGQASTAMGDQTTASGFRSTSMGRDSVASGATSTAMGEGTIASYDYTTAMGFHTTANGSSATAMGAFTIANGIGATAMGTTTTADAKFSTAMGAATKAEAYASLVLGQFNSVAGTTDSWVPTDPVLVVGNGTSAVATSNAFTLLKNGNLTIAGTLTQSSDLRMKKDVAPLTGVLSRISGIRGVSYEFKDTTRSPEGRQIGLVAQEVQAAFPELVREDTEGTLSVSYQNFTAVLLEAVKEQQATIEAKETEIAEVRRELAETKKSMEDRLAKIEKLLRK